MRVLDFDGSSVLFRRRHHFSVNNFNSRDIVAVAEVDFAEGRKRKDLVGLEFEFDVASLGVDERARGAVDELAGLDVLDFSHIFLYREAEFSDDVLKL